MGLAQAGASHILFFFLSLPRSPKKNIYKITQSRSAGMRGKNKKMPFIFGHRKVFSSYKKASCDEPVRQEEKKKEQDYRKNQYFSGDECSIKSDLEVRSDIDGSESNSFSISKYFYDKANLDTYMQTSKESDDTTKIIESPGIPMKPDKLAASDVELMDKALKCIQTRSFDELMEILIRNPSICLKEIPPKTKGLNEAKDGGTLLHILVSMKTIVKQKNKMNNSPSIEINIISAVPQNLLKFIIINEPSVSQRTDRKGRLPIHRAILSMLKYTKGVHRVVSSDEINQISSNSDINPVRLLLACNSSVASVADSYGNLPIHYAASAAPEHIYIKKYMYLGKTVSDPSALDVIKNLLHAYPKGVIVPNKKGMLPLHIACSTRKQMNEDCISLLLLCHQSESGLPVELDSEGDTPLLVAIKNGASASVIRSFGLLSDGSVSSGLFIQRDSKNNNPLHVALIQQPYPNIDVVNTILDLAPFTASTPDGEGIMPIRRGTKLRLPPHIIRKMLACDMPIELGINISHRDTNMQRNRDVMTTTRGLRKSGTVAKHIVGRSHHHSWWHIVVECEDTYIDMVKSFLSEEATHFQIISLARQVGPNGYSIVINCVNDKILLMFHSLLRFNDRYEILLSINASNVICDDVDGGVQRYIAYDHGANFSSLDNLSLEKAHMKMSKSNVVQIKNNNSSVEMSLLPSKDRKMLLRCYQLEEAFWAEVQVREKYQFSGEYFEQLYNVHYDVSYTHLTLSETEKLCCIAFENPDHTMDEVFASVSGSRRSRKWIEKCAVVLKHIAKGIKMLHDQNLVHGYLMPSNVCKYGNAWKICKLGTVLKIGSTVRGSFRASIPPECIILAQTSHSKSKFNSQMKLDDTSDDGSEHLSMATPKHDIRVHSISSCPREKVQFTEVVKERVIHNNKKGEVVISEQQHRMMTAEDPVGKTRSWPTISPMASFFRSKSDVSFFQSPMSPSFFKSKKNSMDDERIIYFPEGIVATPAFDIWGFGVIMANILLGRCMDLPTFEKADDAIMKKLFFYNDLDLEKISNKVEACVGEDAADLIRMLLQKDPRNRPQSMDEVLSHAYFRSIMINI
jgi:ankyrin repeat protein